MRPERHRAVRWRLAAQFAVAAAGVVTLVGSGGGFPQICFDCIGPPSPWPPWVFVTPERVTLQVGQTATFTARVVPFGAGAAPVLQWCRQVPGAASCQAIPGAVSDTYTLPSATLADDGVRLRVSATDANGTGFAAVQLAVTASAGAVFTDTEFAPGAWTAVTSVVPAGLDGRVEVASAASGGNPGAHLAATFRLPAPGGRLSAFVSPASGAEFDPAARGAVYVIDFALDCTRLAWEGSSQVPSVRPVIEQGGRRFEPNRGTATGLAYCGPDWQATPSAISLAATEFVQVDGPACPSAQACPDFSAQAPPIRLGFQAELEVTGLTGPATVLQGFDNWRVTIWPR